MNVQGYLQRGEPWSIGKTKESKRILEYPQRYLAQYPDIFSEEEFDKLPPRRPWDHCIELNVDFKPVMRCMTVGLWPSGIFFILRFCSLAIHSLIRYYLVTRT